MDNFKQLLDENNFDNVVFSDGDNKREYEIVFKVRIEDKFYSVISPLNPMFTEEEDGAFVLYLDENDKSITQVTDEELLTKIFDLMVEENITDNEEDEE